ncbi:MAG TPA: hypothetical protein VLX92_15915 [Kofleriaceae bacterium]|nr:hypothetical protein [Kofleriaceae bacterium]
MRILCLLLVLAAPALARADELTANRSDYDKVTRIQRGVWELDLGALGVLTSDHEGDATVTRLSTDVSAGVHYFIHDNVSVGVEALMDYADTGDGNSATTFGGAVDATLHLRLGLGAFFRPGVALGVLFGNRDTTMTDGTIAQASELGFVAHLRLPIAYFASRKFLLQAGPQIDFTVGSYTPTGGTSTSFTRIAGGFAVGFGYTF